MKSNVDTVGMSMKGRRRARRVLGLALLCSGGLAARTALVALRAQDVPASRHQGESLASSRGDFDGDGKADLFWRNVSTTDVEEWQMQGLSAPVTGSIVLPLGVTPPPANWKVQAIGDFDGGGKADVLWRNQTSGANVLWTMSGFTRDSAAALAGEADLMWAVRGAADFDGDGKVDVLWRHETLEGLRLWLAGTSAVTISTTPGLEWTAAALGDLNGDGKADIVWRHSISGRVVVWLMSGATRTDAAFLPDPTATQALLGVGDLNGDGRDDLLWRDELSGVIELWTTASGGLSVASVDTVGTLDQGWWLWRVGDYDGDGRADLLWRNATSGSVVVWLMNGASIVGGASVGTRSDTNWQIQGGFNWYFGSLAAPGVSPASGTTFVGQLTVALSAPLGATLRYTTDGSEPSAISPRYTAPFPVTSTTTVKVKAFREGWDDSPAATATYTRQAATPALTPGAGTYTNQAVVQITGESGTEIRYTTATAGTPSDPTLSSSLYTGSLLVDRGMTVKARAFHAGWADSAVVTATYAIQLGLPSLSPLGGTYEWDTPITVTGPTPGAVLHYTTTTAVGGADPSEADPTICSGCTLRNPGATLKVKAWKAGTTPSPVASATYDFVRSGRGHVLLVYGGQVGVPAAVKSRLERLGFVVDSIQASNVVRDDASGKALIVIASGPNLGATLKTVTTPILAWETSVYDDMALTDTISNANVVSSQTQINVAASDHPASGGVGGVVTIASGSGMSVSWGDPGTRARVVARAVAPGQTHHDKPVMFAYEVGDPLYDGTRAEGRRLGFFGIDSTSTTPAGWALFDSAVNWLATPTPLALVVTGSTINASDGALIDRLISLGYLPQIYAIGAPDTPPGLPSVSQAESSYKLVVVSSTVDYSNPASYLGGYTNLHVPMVVWEHQAYCDLGMAGGQTFQHGILSGQREFSIQAPTHPLAAGLTGTVDVLNSLNPPDPPPTPVTGTFTWARPDTGQPRSTRIANLTTDTDGVGLPAGIFAYETGEALFDSSACNPSNTPVAPARRVGLFLGDDSAAGMNELGWRLFDAAVNWAIDRDRDSDGDGLSDLDELRYGTNANNPDTNDDGLSDGAAIRMGISATNPDMDGDGLTNGEERHQYGTDPFRADTDGDGCIDHPSSDKFPLDPALCQVSDPLPGSAPVITLTEPADAILVP